MSMGRRAYNILRGYVGREWERIQGVEEEAAQRELLESSSQPSPRANELPPVPEVDREAHARTLLGVGPTASFAEIRKAFQRLNQRSDPANFPPDSPEAAQAAEIQKRVHWAFGVLTEDMDATEKRFKSLEI